jgi:hypothetical protein
MKPEEEKKQWNVCCFCGADKVYGKEFEECVAHSMERGNSREDAEAYFRRSIYMQCPTPEKHKPGHPMIPFEELEHGAYYLGSCRNASVARWNAETKKFVYMREKFYEVYPEEIGYWVTAKPGEHRFDEYKPYYKTENPPFEIPLVAWKR